MPAPIQLITGTLHSFARMMISLRVGMTMDREMLRALGDYLRGFKCVEKTELLPFHKLGEHKWQPGLYTLGDTPAPTSGEISAARDALNGR